MTATIDDMRQHINEMLGRLSLQPRSQHVQDRPKMNTKPRFPYFNDDLHEPINDAAEEKIVADVLLMGYEELQLLNDDIRTQRALDPVYDTTREYVLKCKAGIWRVNQLKKAGKWGPRQSLIEAVGYFMGGWILADEFWKRH